jgi:serine/threonine-protein kinase mTOR
VQDVLRLLRLWYRYGGFEDVKAELDAGFKMVAVDTWLVAIPQMMARIHVEDHFIVEPLKELLVKIGRNHPQALMHPLLARPHSCPALARHGHSLRSAAWCSCV